ncbi:DUF3293 domain-containing protein [Shewanella psychrotolerans]|uniref:DUF3293 domain-containing protein n=1 Tax=Shewanella psychrotolerans TaxID=2864206 RepID=UPI001C656F19|nr:DUF3293 domain-containing protein [Shewanella psychrotolerans]QYK02077.1 DUF3293 domain-containing protein [Shewanella psychrotolerans]
MSTEIDHFWHCYQQTQFLLTQTFSPLLSFAIITAHNPRGEILFPSQNRLLDKQLQRHILKLQYPYRSVVGCSSDKSHMEKSWAITMDKIDAVALGRVFNQNAIYYIEQDQLQLVPCLVNYDELSLGCFSSRVSLVSGLPDIYP